MLSVNDIAFSYDGKKSIFKGVSFQVKEGSVVGIVGPSGAGKSSILKSIAGLITLDEGFVEYKTHTISLFQEMMRWGL